jgi:uracil-DNA glycosylase
MSPMTKIREPEPVSTGKLLDTAMMEAGIDRSRVYVTNSVKHFKFVRPGVIVALGATAAQALLGKHFRVTQERGKPMASELAEAIIATVHPSAVLRAPDGERERARREFVADLKRVATYLQRPKAKAAGSR